MCRTVDMSPSTPCSNSSLLIPLSRSAQYFMKEHAENIMSHIAASPKMWRSLPPGMNLFIQFRYCWNEFGIQSAPMVIAMQPQITLATGHKKKRWRLLSSWPQKEQDIVLNTYVIQVGISAAQGFVPYPDVFPKSCFLAIAHYQLSVSKALIAIEKQKVAEKEAETQKKIALSEAEKNAQVSKILLEQKLMEKDSSKRQQQTDNEMFLEREKALADPNHYRILKDAGANKLKLTPEFLEPRFIESIANSSKIPNKITDQRLLKNYLDAGPRKDYSEM
ncbi:hypothetical protein ACP4OV_027838 [Aristida adscensionis]